MKNQKSRLLLHTCCADCALKFVHSVDNGYEISLYFDNNNIHPRSEYLARLKALKDIAKQNDLTLIISDWSPKKWFEAIDFNEDNQNHRRCKLCWKHRLYKTIEYAKKNKYKFFLQHY